MIINESTKFGEGGRIDNTRFESAFRKALDEDGYSVLHGIFERYAAALTTASGNPATQTINDAITYLETPAQLDLIIAEY